MPSDRRKRWDAAPSVQGFAALKEIVTAPVSHAKLSKAEARARYEAACRASGSVFPFGGLTKAEQRKWRDPLYKGSTDR